MRTENSDSEKDLNANPESSLNTRKPVARPDRFPESREAQGEMEKVKRQQQEEQEEVDAKEEKKDDNIELLADDVRGTVSSRDTSSDPNDIAGVADLDRGLKRGRRR